MPVESYDLLGPLVFDVTHIADAEIGIEPAVWSATTDWYL